MTLVSAQRVAQKADWEGGVLEAMDWYDGDEIDDPKLSAWWSDAKARWLALRPLIDKIDGYLQDIMDAGE